MCWKWLRNALFLFQLVQHLETATSGQQQRLVVSRGAIDGVVVEGEDEVHGADPLHVAVDKRHDGGHAHVHERFHDVSEAGEEVGGGAVHGDEHERAEQLGQRLGGGEQREHLP